LDEFGESEPRSIAERLIELLTTPESAEWLPPGRIVDRVAKLAKSLHEAEQDSNLEELLWGLWSRSGLADRYLAQSQEGGLNAEPATQALDAVAALFALAARYVERNPDGAAEEFTEHMLSSDVPDGTLAAKFA